MTRCIWPGCTAEGFKPLGFCHHHWFYVPCEMRVDFWSAIERKVDRTSAIQQIETWVERYSGKLLTSKICDVRSKTQSAVPTKGESMSNITAKLLGMALSAAATVLLGGEAESTGSGSTGNAGSTGSAPKPRGRPAKPAAPAVSADNDGLDNDGLDNDGLDNDGLDNDGLDNDGLDEEVPAVTEDDLRKTLIELKNLDGDNSRVQKVCARFSGGKSPIVKNVPPEQYAAAIELAKKAIKSGKPKAK